MKAILEFDLDRPEDRAEHKRAVSATSLYMAVLDFDNYLRKRLKYEELPEAVQSALEDARRRLYHELEGNNVSLGDLE